jgi:hypothetical protein
MHNQSVHSEPSVNITYQCKFCDKEMSDRSNHYRHEKLCQQKQLKANSHAQELIQSLKHEVYEAKLEAKDAKLEAKDARIEALTQKLELSNQQVLRKPSATPLIVSSKALRNIGSAETPASRTRFNRFT